MVGLKKVKLLGVENLIIHCDSQLVANQLIREYDTWNERMEAHIKLDQNLFKEFC